MIPQAELDRLLQSPAMKPPPGLTPNLKNPPKHFFADRLVTMVLCLTFATLFVAMRMYTKLFVMKRHGWEDCKIIDHMNQIFLIYDRYMFLSMGTGIRIFILLVSVRKADGVRAGSLYTLRADAFALV